MTFVNPTLAARTMLFGDCRAARSVRIFLRSPLHGHSEKYKVSLKIVRSHNSHEAGVTEFKECDYMFTRFR